MEHDLGEVRQLEQKLLEPEVRTSVTELDALVAAEFLEITSSGNFYGKQHVIEDLPGARVVERIMAECKSLFLAPDVILVTYLLTKPKEPGMPKSRRSSIWKKIDGRWQIIFHQGTNVNL